MEAMVESDGCREVHHRLKLKIGSSQDLLLTTAKELKTKQKLILNCENVGVGIAAAR